MKNKLFITGFALLLSCHVFAQQRPHYTQYILNSFILNPAIAGIETYTDIKMSHRQQWVGLLDAPVTTYFTIQAPTKKTAYERGSATGFKASGENPRGKAYWQEYTKAEAHQGIGFTMLNDQTGPLKRFSAAVTYAYHVGISDQTSVSAGISAGIQNMSLNTSKLVWDIPMDPSVAGSGYLNRISPDLSAGVYLYSANYFAGLSGQQILPSRLKWSEDTLKLSGGRLIPHLFFTAGYKLYLGDDFTLLPSILMKYVNPAPIGIEANAKLQYRDLMWAGTSYRFKDGFAAMVGMNVSNSFNVGYSYDITTTRLNTVSRGTHEIMLGFTLGNSYGDWCPRNLW